MESLKEALEEYKRVTADIYTLLEKGDYKNLKTMFDVRGQFIEFMKTLKYSSEDFTDIYDKLDIKTFDEKLKYLMNEKRIRIKYEIDNISRGLNVRKSYYSKPYADSYYFNKKL